MITEYATVACKSLSKLDGDVNDAIKQGWQPWGSLVSRYSAGDEAFYVQPMVKTDEEQKDAQR